LVIKPYDYKYVGKRSYDWMKIKLSHTEDLPILEVYEGEGRLKGSLGGFVTDHRGIRVKVGSGFSDIQRAKWWNDPPIGLIAEVKYHEITPDGSLRHPVFVRLRYDKC